MTAQVGTRELVRVGDLSLGSGRDHTSITLVSGVDLSIAPGEAVGLVGESGSGKSLTLRSLIDLLPKGVQRTGGTVESRGPDGRPARIAIIFQDSLSALNPTRRVGDIVADGVMATRKCSRREAVSAAVELMRDVGIPSPEERARAWPHELSGGLRQRVGIALALSVEPDILLCDEPTTALDVTVQKQIIELLDRLRRDRGMSLVFVSHDLAVVAQLCSRILVFYAGRIVESAPTAVIVSRPAHMYTRALIDARVETGTKVDRLRPIPGQPPDPAAYTASCRFAPRCHAALPACVDGVSKPMVVAPGHTTTCIRWEDVDELVFDGDNDTAA